MSALSLQIDQPANGAAFVGSGPVQLRASLNGQGSGLFIKWFSSLNSLATADHPELNVTDHSLTSLAFDAPLAEFGTHAIVVSAADQDGIALAAIQSITRSALAGGAPPVAPQPRLIHRLVAQIRTPASAGQTLSKAGSTLEVLAPLRWAKPDPDHAGIWIADHDYQTLNGVSLAFRLSPQGDSDPAHAAHISLSLASLPFFRADDQTWIRWSGALPGGLGVGNHVLTLSATAGGVSAESSRLVILAV
jgi:hypothetical protein